MDNPDDDLTTHDSILVSLLAATDAIWLPSREWHENYVLNPAVTNSYELRKQFRESGIAWASGESTEAGRKEKQRALEELARGGLITIAKPNLSKTLFVRLAAGAYDRTRRQCGLSGFEVGFLMLKLVAHFSVRPATVMQHIYVPETTLNNGRGWGDENQNELFGVSQRALPAFVAAWLNTNCDAERHIYYTVTPAGWKLLDDGWKPGRPVEEIHRDTRFELTYYEKFGIERAKLFTRKPDDDGELGWLRLPVAHDDIPVARNPA